MEQEIRLTGNEGGLVVGIEQGSLTSGVPRSTFCVVPLDSTGST